MMSTTAPRAQRTSLVSAAGGTWKVHAAHGALVDAERHVALGNGGLEAMGAKLVLAEGPREEAAGILEPLEVEDERAFELGLGEDRERNLRGIIR